MSARRDTIDALEATGVFTTVDAAFTMLRRCGVGPALRGLGASAPLAFLVLAFYFLEQVEGIRSLRSLFAVLFVAAWGLRAVVLGSVSLEYVTAAWPGLDPAPRAGRIQRILRTHACSALPLCVWLVPFALVSWLGVVGVALAAPVLCLRAFATPSLLASAAFHPQFGISGWLEAFRDGNDRRSFAVASELWLILGAELVAANLYLAAGLVVLLSRAMLGLDASFVEAFLSFKNTFLMLMAGLSGALLMEPLRAAVHAVHFLDVRVRRPGLDLELGLKAFAEKQRRVSRSARQGLGGLSGAALLLLVGFGMVLAPERLVAQEAAPLSSEWTAADARTTDHVDRILSQDIFRDDASESDLDLSKWIDELLQWLFSDRNWEAPDFGDAPKTKFSPPPELFIGLAVLLLLPILVWAGWSFLRRGSAGREAVPGSQEDAASPLEKAPEAHLDDAAQLAAQGRHREALRSLYLATLVAFDDHRWVPFDASRTNGQLLRMLPNGPVRETFREFTRLFDAKWYGQEHTTGPDYQTSRRLAERITEHLRGHREAA